MAFGEAVTDTTSGAAASDPAVSDPAASRSSGLVDQYRRLHALLDEIASTASESCTEAELVEIAVANEKAGRRLYGLGLQRLVDVDERDAGRVIGESSRRGFCRNVLHLGGETTRRLRHAALVGRFHGMTGETLEPRCPATAAGVADGEISERHVEIIAEVRKRIPDGVGAEVHAATESTLAFYARQHDPASLRQIGARILAHLDPDGRLSDDRDRARCRSLHVRSQDPDLMSTMTASLDPVTRAMLDVVLAVWAAPGMNNPADENSPTGDPAMVDPHVLESAAHRDRRTSDQRNHDAFAAVLRHVLDGDALGRSHRGLPPQLIVTISESALREAAGIDKSVVIDYTPRPTTTNGERRLRNQPAPTATGSLMPIADVVNLAAQAHQHLAVFRDHTSEILHFGRSRRLASRAQRLAACARDAGCTCPGCTAAPFHCELHHVTDWANGGTTDIDSLTDCCGPHNRAVGPEANQWQTTIITSGPDAGRAHWKPPAAHPNQTPQLNQVHDPAAIINRMLAHPDSPPAEALDGKYPEGTLYDGMLHDGMLHDGAVSEPTVSDTDPP